MFKKLTLTFIIGIIVLLNVLLNIIEYYNDIIFDINYPLISIILVFILMYIFIGKALFSPALPRWYKIKKGWHYSINRIWSLFFIGSTIINIKKYKSLSFYIPNTTDDGNFSVHKLFGITPFNVHRTSARFGYIILNDKQFKLVYYYHIAGDVFVVDCGIYNFDEYHVIDIPNSFKAYTNIFGLSFSLFPYFGGKDRTKKDINIYLKLQK